MAHTNSLILGGSHEASTSGANPLNAHEACYEPREGRLLLSPARHPHGVKKHGSKEIRVSITFDIALVALDLATDLQNTRIDESWDAFTAI